MYNRYLRNDQGTYTRVPMPNHAAGQAAQAAKPHFDETPPPFGAPLNNGSHGNFPGQKGERSVNQFSPAPPRDSAKFLDRMLEKLRLQDVDTGDLMLLLLLFFLFEEKADDELLIALGLLLIL